MLSAPSILMAKKYCECRNDFFFMQREEEEWPQEYLMVMSLLVALIALIIRSVILIN